MPPGLVIRKSVSHCSGVLLVGQSGVTCKRIGQSEFPGVEATGALKHEPKSCERVRLTVWCSIYPRGVMATKIGQSPTV